jgi:hypothetical protein
VKSAGIGDRRFGQPVANPRSRVVGSGLAVGAPHGPIDDVHVRAANEQPLARDAPGRRPSQAGRLAHGRSAAIEMN